MPRIPLLSGLFLLFVVVIGCGEGQSVQQVLREVQEKQEGPQAATVEAFYQNRDARPAWVTTRGPTEAGRDFLNRLCQADREGLRPRGYRLDSLAQELQEVYQSPAGDVEGVQRDVARLDVALTATFARYVDDLLHGSVAPEEVGGEWHIETKGPDVITILNRAISEGVGPTLDSLADRHYRYPPLREALERYQSIAEEGGWPTVEAEEPLRPGASGPAVEDLRERLAATKDLSKDLVGGNTYSEAVAEGVRRFEERHGLEVDGIVSEEDRQTLNVSAQERARQLGLNLERYRWMPSDLGHEHVFVNLMDFRVQAYRGAEEVLSMPIVVGEQGWETVAFADTLRYAVFGPEWKVPKSIAKENLLPQLKENPDLLEERGYEILTSEGDTVGVDSLSAEALENSELRIRQKPGPQNPLGGVKYMFPNEHAIYLHDTPADHLFDQRVRASSHGCIRLEDPVAFGDFVFDENQLSGEEIQSLMQEAEQKRVDVQDPLPVYIVYLTAWATQEGTVHFREDRYEYDESLEQALEPPGSAADACSIIRDVFDKVVVTEE